MSLDLTQVCNYFSECSSKDSADQLQRIGFLLCQINTSLAESVPPTPAVSRLRQVDVTASFAALPSVTGTEVSILNTSGAALDIRIGSDADPSLITIPDKQSVLIKVLANANEIQIKGAVASNGVQLVVD